MEGEIIARQNKAYLFIIAIVAILMFSWFWTEGWGSNSKYAYGKTAEEALNFWHARGSSDTGLASTISSVDINNNEKLVFYKNTKNALSSGLVKKKWNNKWMVIEQAGDIPFNDDESSLNEVKHPINWAWHNMKEFGLTYGTIVDENVSKVQVGGKDATILTDNVNGGIWFFISKTGSSYSDNKPEMDIKAFDNQNKILYSY